jgi:hypothetical protein
MSVSLAQAIARVLDHARTKQGLIEIPVADFDVLVGTYKASRELASARRQPDYDHDVCRLYESGYV